MLLTATLRGQGNGFSGSSRYHKIDICNRSATKEEGIDQAAPQCSFKSSSTPQIHPQSRPPLPLFLVFRTCHRPIGETRISHRMGSISGFGYVMKVSYPPRLPLGSVQSNRLPDVRCGISASGPSKQDFQKEPMRTAKN